jgi:hypothetical protein
MILLPAIPSLAIVRSRSHLGAGFAAARSWTRRQDAMIVLDALCDADEDWPVPIASSAQALGNCMKAR